MPDFAENSHKNRDRHRVTPEEAEDVFYMPLVVRGDLRHSRIEKRYDALGQTGTGQRMFVAFTIRGRLIRVISATDNMKKKLPEFRNEDEERNFWATADSTRYGFGAGKAYEARPAKALPKEDLASLPVSMIEHLKALANRRDIPYQSPLKVFLSERLAQERGAR